MQNLYRRRAAPLAIRAMEGPRGAIIDRLGKTAMSGLTIAQDRCYEQEHTELALSE